MNQNPNSEISALLKNESVWMFKSFTGEESQETIERYLRQADNDMQHAINSYFNDQEKETIKKELKFCDPFLKSSSEEERPSMAFSKGNQSTQSSGDKMLEWDFEGLAREQPKGKFKRPFLELEKPFKIG